jgi:alginate o-acetyltransferase algJ
MKKNLLYRLYSAAFIGICLVPAALMPIFKTDSDKEKRELASAPKIKTEEGKLNFDFFSDFETYFSEHFAFRQQLVTADGRIRSAVFGTSPNSDVIVGKNGWLYYGETVDDFLNINTLSDRAVNNIKNNLDMMNAYCEQNNAQFVFTVAPNKNSVYPENMPFNYIESENPGSYEKLAETLSGSSYWCDMKEALLNTSSSIPLYHKTDTHWNNLGAYAGHSRIMAMIGKESCPSGSRWFTRNDRLGDLAAMIYPAEKAKDTQVYNDYEFSYSYLGRFQALDDISIKTVCEGKEGSLLMYRDSYGEAILPYMAECFGEAEFSRAVPYRMNTINGGTVVLEIVERNIGNLQKYAPVMNAPEADISGLVPEKVIGAEAVVRIEKSGMFTHIYGELPEEFFSGDNAEIFVTVGEKSYKAFNCFEDKLLEREGETSDRGFSLYIQSENDISEDDIEVLVMNEYEKTFSTK